MLFAQIQCKLVHQGGLVCAGMDLLAANVVRVNGRVTVDKLLAVWRLVNQSIVLGYIHRTGGLGQQYGDVLVLAASLALLVCGQVSAK